MVFTLVFCKFGFRNKAGDHNSQSLNEHFNNKCLYKTFRSGGAALTERSFGNWLDKERLEGGARIVATILKEGQWGGVKEETNGSSKVIDRVVTSDLC